LIGAGSGLSTAAGLEYGGKRFTDNFADFIDRYGLSDMYSSAFYRFPSLQEKWAYFSRHIYLNRYAAEAGKVYKDLLNIVTGKDYFVITTNVDAQFVKAGFQPDRIFATQGDYGLFQCQKACHDKLYDNEAIVKQMVEQQKDCRIPGELVPTCPVCGGYLVPHLRIDGYFVENEDWHAASQRYTGFLKSVANKKVVLLELGVGYNTPGIIRYPFEEMSMANPKHKLIRINLDNVQPGYVNAKNNVLIKADISKVIEEIC